MAKPGTSPEAFSVTAPSTAQIDNYYSGGNAAATRPITYDELLPKQPVLPEEPAPAELAPALTEAPVPDVAPFYLAPSAVVETPMAAPEVHSRHIGRTITAAALALAVVGSGAKYAYDHQPKTSAAITAKGKAAAGSEPAIPDGGITAANPDTSQNPGINLIAPPELTTPTPTTSSISPRKPTASKTAVPKTKISTPIPSLKIVVPPKATSPTPRSTPHISPTPSPTPTTPEATPTPELPPVIPDNTNVRLLNKSANKDRAQQLAQDDETAKQFLDKPELGFLSTETLQAFQGNLKDIYATQAKDVLSPTPYLDEDTLRSLNDSGKSPATTLIGYTDNVLNHATELYPSLGDKISRAAYLNNDLSSNLTQQLNNQEDVKPSSSSNEEVIGKVREVNGVDVVPVVASYLNKDYQTVNVINWEALVPVRRTQFIGVVVLTKTVQPNTYAPSTDTPSSSPEATPSDQNNAENTGYSDKKSHAHHNKNRD